MNERDNNHREEQGIGIGERDGVRGDGKGERFRAREESGERRRGRIGRGD